MCLSNVNYKFNRRKKSLFMGLGCTHHQGYQYFNSPLTLPSAKINKLLINLVNLMNSKIAHLTPSSLLVSMFKKQIKIFILENVFLLAITEVPPKQLVDLQYEGAAHAETPNRSLRLKSQLLNLINIRLLLLLRRTLLGILI